MAGRWYSAHGVKRAKINGEVFTPHEFGQEMLKLLVSRDSEAISGVFLDPSCGDGNLLLCVLMAKIEHGIAPHKALENIYGIELMNDNVLRCRQRLLAYALEQGGDQEICSFIINNNCTDSSYSRIVCYDTMQWDVANWCPLDDHQVVSVFS